MVSVTPKLEHIYQVVPSFVEFDDKGGESDTKIEKEGEDGQR